MVCLFGWPQNSHSSGSSFIIFTYLHQETCNLDQFWRYPGYKPFSKSADSSHCGPPDHPSHPSATWVPHTTWSFLLSLGTSVNFSERTEKKKRNHLWFMNIIEYLYLVCTSFVILDSVWLLGSYIGCPSHMWYSHVKDAQGVLEDLYIPGWILEFPQSVVKIHDLLVCQTKFKIHDLLIASRNG